MGKALGTGQEKERERERKREREQGKRGQRGRESGGKTTERGKRRAGRLTYGDVTRKREMLRAKTQKDECETLHFSVRERELRQRWWAER